MTVEIVCETDTLTSSDPRWHELRRQGFGGSDAPVLLGLTRKSEYELWTEKVSTAPPDVTAQGHNTPRDWGHRLEPVLADYFSETTGLEVVDVPLLLRSVEYPFMQANLDRMVRALTGSLAGPLECKTTTVLDEWERVGDILSVPAWVQAQCVHYLSVTQYPVCYGAVFLMGRGTHAEIFEIERNEKLEAELIDIEARAWDLVERRVAPMVDGSDSTRKALSRRWQAQRGKVITLPEQPTRFLWEQRSRLVAEIKERADIKDEIENELLAMCGDAEEAHLGEDKLFTWRAGKTYKLDARQLEKDQPALVASYRTIPPSRRVTWSNTDLDTEEES